MQLLPGMKKVLIAGSDLQDDVQVADKSYCLSSLEFTSSQSACQAVKGNLVKCQRQVGREGRTVEFK